MSLTTPVVFGSVIAAAVTVLIVVLIALAVRVSRLREELDLRAPLRRPRSHRPEPKRTLREGRRTEPQRMAVRFEHQPTAVMPLVVPGEQPVRLDAGERSR